MARILVVDDEPAHRDSLRRIFERAGHEVVVAADGDEAIALLQREAVHVVLTDLVMPKRDGTAVLKAAKAAQPEADVILMTAYGTVENAVQAMRDGAYDFLTKPTRRGEVLACLERVLERQRLIGENRALKAELEDARADRRGLQRLIGTSDAIRQLKATIQQVAPTSAALLLTGESGTGKELVARAIHEGSARAGKPFVAVNCASLPESILAAELFGAEKGAFTGATERRLGRFERADGGTLLLDEVGDIPLLMQVQLLRVLQEGEIERLGGQDHVPVNVRIIAATHVDLRERVRQGLFREDLYYRLDVITLQLPPLRERDGDIPVLAMHFLQAHAARHGKSVRHIEPRAMAALAAWHFPGNVRELDNAVERGVVLCPGDALRVEDLPAAIQGAGGRPHEEMIAFRVGRTTLEQIERAAIDATLAHAGGDKVLTAKLLGLSLRTLYRRIGEKPEGVEDEP